MLAFKKVFVIIFLRHIGLTLSFNAMKTFFILALTVMASAASATWVWAVTQGTLGPSSTLTMNFEIEIGREVRVFNLDSVDLGVFDFNNAQIQNNETFCVYDNGAAFTGMTYRITFDSANTPGVFELVNGANTIAYQVEYDDSQTSSNFRTASPGSPITGNVNGSTGDTDCTSVGGDNGNVRITVNRTDAQGSPDGVYSDTISVLVEPE